MKDIGFDTSPRQEELSQGDYVNVFLSQPPITVTGSFYSRNNGEWVLSEVFGVVFNKNGERKIAVLENPQHICASNISSYIKTTEQDYRGRMRRCEEDLETEELRRKVDILEIRRKHYKFAEPDKDSY